MPFPHLRVASLNSPILHFPIAKRGVEFSHLLLEVADGERESFDFLDRLFDLPCGSLQVEAQTAQLGCQRRVALGTGGRARAR